MSNLTETDKEKWVLYEDNPTYAVSDMGRVKNANTGYILRPWKTKKGYLKLRLADKSSPTRQSSIFVHRLVMYAFVGKQPSTVPVDHINNNRVDNRLTNLRYVTQNINLAKEFIADPRFKYSDRWGRFIIPREAPIEKYNKHHRYIRRYLSINEAVDDMVRFGIIVIDDSQMRADLFKRIRKAIRNDTTAVGMYWKLPKDYVGSIEKFE